MKFSIKSGEKMYLVEIENLSVRPIIARIDDDEFEIWPESELPLSTDADLMESTRSTKESLPKPKITGNVPSGAVTNTREVRAPIPGVVVEVQVKEADIVEHGQTVFIIEAMKMRNAIRASRPGKVSQVYVSPGQTVNHNDLLLEFTE